MYILIAYLDQESLWLKLFILEDAPIALVPHFPAHQDGQGPCTFPENFGHKGPPVEHY